MCSPCDDNGRREGTPILVRNRRPRRQLTAKTGRLRPMPMYHVHVAKEGKTFDPKAVELPDTKSVKRHAKRVAEGLTALSSGFGVGSLAIARSRSPTRMEGQSPDTTFAWRSNAAATSGRSDVQRRLRF